MGRCRHVPRSQFLGEKKTCDVWDKISTFDPADTKQEAIEFIKEFLSDCPKAKAMTREQLENALAEEDDEFWKERVRIWKEREEWS